MFNFMNNLIIDFYKKEHPVFDDNITIIEDKLSDYDISFDSKSTSEICDISYNSAEDDIKIDNDGLNIYKLKYDYCSKYGKDQYNIVLQRYNDLIKKIDISNFNQEIWLSSVDIYFNSKYNKSSCFSAIINKKKNNENIKKIYNSLLVIDNNSKKLNIWHQCCKECTI